MPASRSLFWRGIWKIDFGLLKDLEQFVAVSIHISLQPWASSPVPRTIFLFWVFWYMSRPKLLPNSRLPFSNGSLGVVTSGRFLQVVFFAVEFLPPDHASLRFLSSWEAKPRLLFGLGGT